MIRPVAFKGTAPPQMQATPAREGVMVTELPQGSEFFITEALTQGSERLPTGGPFSYPKLVRLATLMDSSSLLHAIVNSTMVNYRQGILTDGKVVSQTEWIRVFRNTLATYLRKPHPKSGGKVTYYESLFTGKVDEVAAKIPEYKLEAMEKVLSPDAYIGVEFIHYISEFLDIDVYIIDLAIMDVFDYRVEDLSVYHKGRKSVVIGYINKHFESIAIEEQPKIYSMPFIPDNKLIIKLRGRLEQKQNEIEQGQ